MPSQSDSQGGWRPGFKIIIDRDLADTLTEQYNGYAMQMEDLEVLDAEFVFQCLSELFDHDDLNDLIDDDYGRGLVMGQIAIQAKYADAFAIDEVDDNE